MRCARKFVEFYRVDRLRNRFVCPWHWSAISPHRWQCQTTNRICCCCLSRMSASNSANIRLDLDLIDRYGLQHHQSTNKQFSMIIIRSENIYSLRSTFCEKYNNINTIRLSQKLTDGPKAVRKLGAWMSAPCNSSNGTSRRQSTISSWFFMISSGIVQFTSLANFNA